MARPRVYRHDVRCPECGSNWMPRTAHPKAAWYIIPATRTPYHPRCCLPVPSPCGGDGATTATMVSLVSPPGSTAQSATPPLCPVSEQPAGCTAICTGSLGTAAAGCRGSEGAPVRQPHCRRHRQVSTVRTESPRRRQFPTACQGADDDYPPRLCSGAGWGQGVLTFWRCRALSV